MDYRQGQLALCEGAGCCTEWNDVARWLWNVSYSIDVGHGKVPNARIWKS